MKIELLESKDIPKEIADTDLSDLSKIYVVAQHMEKICLDKKGVGLSAVQVVIPWKFFIYLDENSNKFKYMINCNYEPIGEEKYLSIEGCLSIFDFNGNLKRFKLMRDHKVKITGKQLILENNELKLVDFEEIFEKGFTATVFQHEIDHQNGILISDIGEEIQIHNCYNLG